jgi:flavodoxin I
MTLVKQHNSSGTPLATLATRRSKSSVFSVVCLGFSLVLSWSLFTSLASNSDEHQQQPRRESFAVPASAAKHASKQLRARSSGACRGEKACRRAVGLFYATSTGNTMTVANLISEATGIEPVDIGDADPADFKAFDGLIVGAPTWNTGADEERSGTEWDDILEEVKELALAGKPVAVFGCGDSQAYGDNFCEAMEELHSTFQAAGANMIGYVDASGYEHRSSKTEKDGKFVGLPIDQDNEDDKTEGRVSAWIDQLKSEGMPLG